MHDLKKNRKTKIKNDIQQGLKIYLIHFLYFKK